jgi:hypothetical protein
MLFKKIKVINVMCLRITSPDLFIRCYNLFKLGPNCVCLKINSQNYTRILLKYVP